MYRLTVALLFSVVVVTPGLCQSKKISCRDTAMTQMEMNECAAAEDAAADAELNHLYQMLLSEKKGDANAIKKLRAAQRAWLAFKNAHLQALFPAQNKQEYGSIFPMCYMRISTAMTKERIDQFRRMLSGEDGPC